VKKTKKKWQERGMVARLLFYDTREETEGQPTKTKKKKKENFTLVETLWPIVPHTWSRCASHKGRGRWLSICPSMQDLYIIKHILIP
jgi:hypothetical protein